MERKAPAFCSFANHIRVGVRPSTWWHRAVLHQKQRPPFLCNRAGPSQQPGSSGAVPVAVETAAPTVSSFLPPQANPLCNMDCPALPLCLKCRPPAPVHVLQCAAALAASRLRWQVPGSVLADMAAPMPPHFCSLIPSPPASQVAEQIRAAQQKAALSGQAPAAWAIGARCQVKTVPHLGGPPLGVSEHQDCPAGAGSLHRASRSVSRSGADALPLGGSTAAQTPSERQPARPMTRYGLRPRRQCGRMTGSGTMAAWTASLRRATSSSPLRRGARRRWEPMCYRNLEPHVLGAYVQCAFVLM